MWSIIKLVGLAVLFFVALLGIGVAVAVGGIALEKYILADQRQACEQRGGRFVKLADSYECLSPRFFR